MSLEEERVAASKKILEELEKKCKVHDSLFKRLKKKVKSGTQVPADTMSQEDKWTCQIIVADTLLFQAVLTFINQDIPSYVKGGWLLRKAWKIYNRVYHDILPHHTDDKKHGKVKVKVDLAHTKLLEDELTEDILNANGTTVMASGDFNAEDGPTELMSRETISRLLGAVSFGYGMFQLAMSMMPEKVLKLIKFLGFQGNRQIGLEALEYSMNSSDMRAPLAVLSMLWYHVIMKPFFTENLPDEELKTSADLISKYQADYPQSSIFLFFKGRLWRLQRNLDAALQEYEKVKVLSEGSQELKNGAYFEIAWCNMMKQNYDVSYESFTILVEKSKWSKCFYTYMLSLCAGGRGRIDEATRVMQTVPGLVKKKTNQIEAFVSRRAQQFKKIKLTETICELLMIELIYVWNSLPQCSQQEAEKMLSVCGALEEKKFFHLRSLLEGALYRHLGDLQFSEQCFKEAVARHEGLKHDYHVAAHALFELGSYRIKSPDTKEEGRKMLLKAKDSFKEYDFENRLNVKIRNVLKTLDK